MLQLGNHTVDTDRTIAGSFNPVVGALASFDCDESYRGCLRCISQ